MHQLDDAKLRAGLDRSGAVRAIDLLGEQARQAWREARALKFPASYTHVEEIVMNGMGGSGLAGHIIEAAFRGRLRVPFFLTHSYEVPAHVGSRSLFILSSYSGATEEVLMSLRLARARHAKLLGIASGGALGRAIRSGTPGYKFFATYNPGNVPRLGQGYMIFGLLGVLAAARLLRLARDEVKLATDALAVASRRFGPAVPLKRNRAKQLAAALHGKIPVFVGAEFLEDSARVMSNQVHESSKQFGCHFAIPELNHHLMEGLTFPRGLAQKLAFVFFPSALYHPRVQKRFSITRDVVRHHKIPVYAHRPTGSTPFAQIAELLSFGSYVTYYLGLLNRVDPSPNPWVDYFKRRLGKVTS